MDAKLENFVTENHVVRQADASQHFRASELASQLQLVDQHITPLWLAENGYVERSQLEGQLYNFEQLGLLMDGQGQFYRRKPWLSQGRERLNLPDYAFWHGKRDIYAALLADSGHLRRLLPDLLRFKADELVQGMLMWLPELATTQSIQAVA